MTFCVELCIILSLKNSLILVKLQSSNHLSSGGKNHEHEINMEGSIVFSSCNRLFFIFQKQNV